MAPTQDGPVSSRRASRRTPSKLSVSFAEEVETLEVPIELYGSVLSFAEPSNFQLATANMKASVEGEMPMAMALQTPLPEEPPAPSPLRTLARLGLLLLGPCFGGDAKQLAGTGAAHRVLEVSRPGESPC